MRGALIGSRRTAIVLVLGLALAGCTTTGDSAEPAPTAAAPAPASSSASPPLSAGPQAASSQTIHCLDGRWAFGPVERHEVLTAVSTPVELPAGIAGHASSLRPVRRLVTTIDGNAPPELTYARLRALVTHGPPLAPLGVHTEPDTDLWQVAGPGVFVSYETADVISASFAYVCAGVADVGAVTSWAPHTNGILRCDGKAAAPDGPIIAEVRAIACPPINR
jgi:hypothetical protein